MQGGQVSLTVQQQVKPAVTDPDPGGLQETIPLIPWENRPKEYSLATKFLRSLESAEFLQTL